MSEVLQEYVVNLILNVKEESQKRFDKATAATSQIVSRLGAAAVAAAAAVSVAVEQISKRYEDLYYASQRTGESVKGLMSYEYAARQIGVSAAAARGSVEAFASAMRTSPGLSGLARQLGGTASQPVEQMQQMIAKLKANGTPYYAAYSMMRQFGLDETTTFQMWNNIERLTASGEKYKSMLKSAGLDTEKVAEDSVRLQRAMGELGGSFDILGTKLLHNLIGPMEQLTHGFSQSMQMLTASSPQEAAALSEKFGKENFERAKANPELRGIAHGENKFRGAVEGWWNQFMQESGLSHDLGRAGGKGAAAPSGNASAAIDYFMQQGWTREQATGIAANLKAESAFNPAEIGDSRQAYGIAQWHPDRQRDFAKWAGHDIRGSTFEEQLGFIQHELTAGKEQAAGKALRGASGYFESGATFSRAYERPLRASAEAASRGNQAAQWGAAQTTHHNNVTVHIAGKADAEAVKRGVEQGLTSFQNSQMIRQGNGVR
jgi:hypothetical protein